MSYELFPAKFSDQETADPAIYSKHKSRAAELLAKVNNQDALQGPKVLSYGATGLVLGVRSKGFILYAEGEFMGERIAKDSESSA